MREILFRGKRIYNGEWLYGNIRFYEDFEPHYMIDEQEKSYRQLEVIPETIGQFTGLTDKNGSKIFEGDIVEFNTDEYHYTDENPKFREKIVNECGAFGIASNQLIPLLLDNYCSCDNFISLWEMYWNFNCSEMFMGMIEVIGNIHDNPKLLEEEE